MCPLTKYQYHSGYLLECFVARVVVGFIYLNCLKEVKMRFQFPGVHCKLLKNLQYGAFEKFKHQHGQVSLKLRLHRKSKEKNTFWHKDGTSSQDANGAVDELYCAFMCAA